MIKQKIIWTVLKLFFYLKREGFSGAMHRVQRKFIPDPRYSTWNKKNGVSKRKGSWNIGEIHKFNRNIDIIFLEDNISKKTISKLDKQIYKPRGIYTNMYAGGGEYILLVQGNVDFEIDALYEFYQRIRENPAADIIYCDHDIEYSRPVFKPDFNYDLLLSYNYIGNVVLIRRKQFDFIRVQQQDKANIYEIIFQLIEIGANIDHIPIVLYHDMKECTEENTIIKGIIRDHLVRMGYNISISNGIVKRTFRVRYKLLSEPMVSIIIPNMDHIGDLKKCLNSIIQKQKYKNYEIIIVENNSVEGKTFEYYKYLLKTFENIRVLHWKKKFNYPAINNYAVKNAKGKYVLVGVCSRKDVGAVGGKLYYSDRTIQHAGIIVGYGGIAGHAFLNCDGNMNGYMGRINCCQNYSAVTAACMLVKKEIYEAVGGMDTSYKVAFNDVDFCLKIVNKGLRIVYTPFAEAYHYESKTRGADDNYEKMKRFNQEIDLFRSKWEKYISDGDPAYNPNLTLYKWDFSLRK